MAAAAAETEASEKTVQQADQNAPVDETDAAEAKAPAAEKEAASAAAAAETDSGEKKVIAQDAALATAIQEEDIKFEPHKDGQDAAFQ